MPPISLSHGTVRQLPDEVARPSFDPARLRPGIVHLGLGGFHRAHMARYTHDLLQQGGALDWGIIGVGLLPRDRGMQQALAPQDGLYTLVERDQSAESATVIGSIRRVIFAAESAQSTLAAIAHPSTRIVSFTVTEQGYCLNPASKQLDFLNPAIIQDLARPQQPHTAIGILTEAYRQRMGAGQSAVTALTCDNIQHNGRVLKAAVLAFAERCDPRLARWIEAHASFPSTMVDRITPITTPGDIAYLASRYQVEDNWPVFSETFRQWVIEDHFVDGRPDWENVGVQFVADVAPYELMKLRLLNASHLALAGLGRLAGFKYIDEVLGDVDCRAYMQALMNRETGPTLPAIPGIDLAEYKATLLSRFANPNIKDTVDRVNTDAPINLLIDPIRDRLDAEGDVSLLSLALAAWMKRVAGVDDLGAPIAIVHPLAEVLRSRARQGGSDPRPLLSVASLFGDLVENQRFVATLGRSLAALYEHGAKASIAQVRLELKF